MRILLWILALLSVAALVVWLNMGRIAERGIGYVLGQRDIPVQSYRIVTLSRSHIVLRDLVLGDHGELKAGQLDLRIGWNGSKAETYEVTLKAADVMVRTGEGGIALDGLERAWQKTPVALSGEITDIQLQGDMSAHYTMGGAVKLAATATTITAARDGMAMVMPLVLDGTAQGNLTNTLTYSGTLVSEKKQVKGRFNGSYDMAHASGKTEWSIDPVRFTPDGLTFGELTPLYAETVPTFPMRLSAKGVLTLTRGSWQLTPNLTFIELPLETLLAGVLGDDAKVEGTVGGGIPLSIAPGRWQIKPATLSNKGDLKIAVSHAGRAAEMLATHPQSEIVLGALGNFHVHEMSLKARSTDNHGGVNLTWHFLGANPELYGGKKVDFTLAVNANLEDIWISATRAESLAEKAQDAATKKGAN